MPILAAAAFACSAGPPKEAAPAAKPPIAAPADGSPVSRWGVVELASLPGTVTLYDPGRWQAAAGETFSTLEHPPSRSRLALRTWRAAPDVRPAQCEAEARLVRPNLPVVDPEAIVDSRRIDAPRKFYGTLVVGVEPMPDGSTRGFALVVSATIGRCFVLCFETAATGAGGSASVADRLHEAVDGIVPSVELRGVDERVRPEFNLK